ncbi:conserved hypothetical protein [Candidatus Methylobacter favarea]|uniref:Lipoprotein n=1 Tax=Candidatus Methylobacter favarea TaxID=2707345 RepID=A0A8S0WC81_9GAMM|nr:hypothetical protein [Candidatus Methylobacter favarea]CAA9892295.1 conserved hypothetical protein [Candidatus Methylobacter favarea]
MKFIIKLTIIALFISIVGCDDDVKPIKTSNTEAVKAGLEAVEKAKKTDQTVQDAALKQQRKIEEITC